MIKNWSKLFTLSAAIPWAKRHVPKFLLAASLLVSSAMTYIPINAPFTYPANGNSVVRRSELGPLTGTTYNSATAHGPGHDFGAFGNEIDFVVSLPAARPFSYMLNGNTIVRRSELGPLTGTVDSSLPAPRPGHDFGAIGD